MNHGPSYLYDVEGESGDPNVGMHRVTTAEVSNTEVLSIVRSFIEEFVYCRLLSQRWAYLKFMLAFSDALNVNKNAFDSN